MGRKLDKEGAWGSCVGSDQNSTVELKSKQEPEF
jgi:hypothetical protein